MENASKAIIIAGTILITIILLSIGVVLWNKYGSFSNENVQNTRKQQLEEFNVKFKKYEFNGQATEDDDKNYITPQDVRTIVNLAKDYNSKYEDEIIEVFYNGGMRINNWSDEEWRDFLVEGNKYNKQYKVKLGNSNGNSDIITTININEA